MKPLLTAQIAQDEVGVTLYCPELNIHTCGRTRQEAESKLVDAIIDYYHFLRNHDFSRESPYKEHLELLVNHVLPALAEASLLSPRRPLSLLDNVLDLLSQQGGPWYADVFGNLKSAVVS